MAISSQSDASAAAQIRGAVIKRRAEWRADTLFAELVAVEAEDPALKRKAAEIFETDVAAEFDARHLSARLAVYMADWPNEIAAFMETWDRDEDNHYRGLRHLLQAVTGESEESIHMRMMERIPDFAGIEPFINDPFRFLVALAYDECVTVQAYATDYPLYDALGPGAGRWVRLANRDEALHYGNAVRLVRNLYKDRVDEVPDLLTRLVSHDQQRSPYRATFLLDHDFPLVYFSPDKLRRSADRVARAICR